MRARLAYRTVPKDWDMITQTRPQPLNTFAVRQSKGGFQPRVKLKLALPLMRVGVHSRRGKDHSFQHAQQENIVLQTLPSVQTAAARRRRPTAFSVRQKVQLMS